MVTFLTGLLLLGVGSLDSIDPAVLAEFRSAADRLVQASSYSAVVTVHPAPRPLAEEDAERLRVAYQRGRPVHFQATGLEAYRRENRMAYRLEGEDHWHLLEELPPAGAPRDEGLEVPPALALVSSLRLPHEFLEGLETALVRLERAEPTEEGHTVLEGVVQSPRLPQGIRVVVTPDGVPQLITLRPRPEPVDAADPRNVELRYRIQALGDTRVEVPDEVRELLEQT